MGASFLFGLFLQRNANEHATRRVRSRSPLATPLQAPKTRPNGRVFGSLFPFGTQRRGVQGTPAVFLFLFFISNVLFLMFIFHRQYPQKNATEPATWRVRLRSRRSSTPPLRWTRKTRPVGRVFCVRRLSVQPDTSNTSVWTCSTCPFDLWTRKTRPLGRVFHVPFHFASKTRKARPFRRAFRVLSFLPLSTQQMPFSVHFCVLLVNPLLFTPKMCPNGHTFGFPYSFLPFLVR